MFGRLQTSRSERGGNFSHKVQDSYVTSLTFSVNASDSQSGSAGKLWADARRQSVVGLNLGTVVRGKLERRVKYQQL